MNYIAQVTYIYCASDIYLKIFCAQLPCECGIYMKLLLYSNIDLLICQYTII